MESPRPEDKRTLLQNLELLMSAERPRALKISEIVEAVGDKGFGLLLTVLSLPSALPVPAPGYSTPFGILIVCIGLQLVLGRRTLWLPKRAKKTKLSAKMSGRMLKAARTFLKKTERFVRPRFFWVSSRVGEAMVGLLVIAMAGLMILPIPLTNTFPAMVIFLIGVGLSEDDGVWVLLAFLVGALSACFYAYVLYLFFTLGLDGVIELKNWILSLLGF